MPVCTQMRKHPRQVADTKATQDKQKDEGNIKQVDEGNEEAEAEGDEEDEEDTPRPPKYSKTCEECAELRRQRDATTARLRLRGRAHAHGNGDYVCRPCWFRFIGRTTVTTAAEEKAANDDKEDEEDAENDVEHEKLKKTTHTKQRKSTRPLPATDGSTKFNNRTAAHVSGVNR